MIDDEELTRRAVEELMREAKIGAAKAELCGPTGWQKCPLQQTNKRFLRNYLLNVESSNRRKGKSFRPPKQTTKCVNYNSNQCCVVSSNDDKDKMDITNKRSHPYVSNKSSKRNSKSVSSKSTQISK